MSIGIVPVISGHSGGIYQYSYTMLDALYRRNAAEEFVVFAEDAEPLGNLGVSRKGWSVQPLYPNSIKKVGKQVVRRLFGEERLHEIWEWKQKHRARVTPGEVNLDAISFKPALRRWIEKFDINLMMYPMSTTLSFEIGIPYVMAIHDLQHRLQPEFPEVSADNQQESREYLFRNGTRNATIILADSETGKEDILNFYADCGLTEDRVKVLPFLPAAYLPSTVAGNEIEEVKKKYALPERYLFYPAQFWPHKNHARIIEALALLKREQGFNIPILLCGSQAGKIRTERFDEIMKLAETLGLQSMVRHVGYVPNEDMGPLYAGAVALIFPTFFGPTNIPVLEAWAFGCPVLTSNIRGIREQVGDAGILVNPKSVEELADGIRRLWTEQTLRESLATLGRKRLTLYTPQDFAKRLSDILVDANNILSSNIQSKTKP